MFVFILRRLALGALVFLAVTALCFVLFYVRGGESIVTNLLGANAQPNQVEAKVVQLGLDRPLVVQYVDWIVHLFQGDLGRSFVSGQDVMTIMSTRVPVTLSLILAALVITVIFSVLFGVVAASFGGVFDRGLQGMSVFLNAVPNYWLALLIVIVFSLNLRLFPATGFVPIQQSLAGWFSTITLPSIAIALGGTFFLAVLVRSSILDMRRQEWVRTLRSHGVSETAIMFRHILRNAAAPTIQFLGLIIIGLLGGAVFVERVFALPGVGMLALTSGLTGDVPVVLGAATFMVVVIVIINLLVEIVNGLLNPKVRVS